MDNILTLDELKLQIHHIGGIGDCGPTELLTMLREEANWFYYDADEESLNKCNTEKKSVTLINACIGDKDCRGIFHIAENKSASGMLKPSPRAENYVLPGDKIIKWGDHAKTIKSVMVHLNKLDTVIESKKINKIDFLSIDTQGYELKILKGIKNNLKDVLGIVCEVEFVELYKNQPLIFDIHRYLKNNGFRFVALYNMQYFGTQPYPKDLMGQGFLTVGEALFIREPEIKTDKESVIKIFKTAMIMACFNQRDYAINLLHELDKKIKLDDLKSDSRYFNWLMRSMKVAKEHLWNT